ncbi:response regulator [Myxococcota bacterium]|nr:response regulator [Myxococcota bacterium]MBU1431766.1 response regulator [Myxococcota bacterium]MBU1897461.1 response regulator [Myxococcota bacterium]
MSDDARKLILLADDDPEIRSIVRRTLSSLDLDLIEARDGEEALEKVIVEHPDLLVLDVMMPTLTGWEICKYIKSREEYDDIAVLMLTAVGPAVNAMTAPLYGADAYLDKPFSIKDLLEKVKALLAAQG